MIKKLLTRLLDTALKLRVIPVNILNPKNVDCYIWLKTKNKLLLVLQVKTVRLKSSYTVNLLKTL